VIPNVYVDDVHLVKGEPFEQRKMLRRLTDMQYQRN